MANAADGIPGYALLAFVGVALLVVVGVVWVVGAGLSVEVLAVLALSCVVVLASNSVYAAKARQQRRRVPRIGPIDFSETNLSSTYSIPGVDSDFTLTIVDVIEDCPWGLKTGDTVRIDSEGYLSRPLCKNAAGTVGDAVRGMDREERSPVDVTCYCPATDKGLTFQLAPSSTTA